MTVEHLQKYLRALAGAMGDGKSADAPGLTAVADRMEAFKGLEVGQFADFLATAWEYKTTGVLPLPAQASGATKKVRSSGAAAPDPKKVDDIYRRVKAAHDR